MSGGEKSVLIGNDGEKIMREFLKLVGWDNLSQNVTFDCFLGKKHKISKSKSDKTNHNIDGTFYYDSPLNHNETDIILCSSKHNLDEYSSSTKAYAHLKELAHSLECAPRDFTFSNDFENDDNKRKVFKGLLFWISSNSDEQNVSMIDKISLGLINEDEEEDSFLGKLKGILFENIYLVDNHKATFIASAIKTAQSIHPNCKVQFLFPHTGSNNRTEDLNGFGEIMPIQFINTALLPIVIDDGEKVSILIFCDSDFSKDYLKRIIWLTHKISDLVGSITIFFNNYDKTKDEESANRVKQLFQNSNLTSKIIFRRINVFDFVTLKEEQVERQINNISSKFKRSEILSSLPIEDDIDKILPYGEMIKPIINSSSLSDSDIKAFLIRKGIYIGNKEKQTTVPLLATLLLSPEELNFLKYSLKAKEDKIKSVPRKTELSSKNTTVKQVAQVINQSIENSIAQIFPPQTCSYYKKPKVELKDDEVVINFVLEKQNTTKDLITGKVHNEGSIRFKLSDGNMDGQINYTSREVLAHANKLFKFIEKELVDTNIIATEFYSITFDSFDNKQRIDFFLNFLNMRGEPSFSNARLEHMVVKPDSSIVKELPFDLESLKDKVNNLSISGQELDTVHFFQDNYKEVLLMQKVKIKYSFEFIGTKGNCIVDLDFKNALNGETDAELSFTLDIIKRGSIKGVNIDSMTQKLRKVFNTILQKKYINKEKSLNTI